MDLKSLYQLIVIQLREMSVFLKSNDSVEKKWETELTSKLYEHSGFNQSGKL